MSDSLRAKAAAAIKGARHGAAPEGRGDEAPGTVTTSDLTFSVGAEDLRWIEKARAKTLRALDPDQECA